MAQAIGSTLFDVAMCLSFFYVLVVLLCGGDKNSQKKDIDVARRLAREWKEADNDPLDDTL